MPPLDPIIRLGWRPSSVNNRVIEFDQGLRERIISFEYTDKSSGGDTGKLTMDNFDLALFDSEAFRAETRLYVQWGFPHLMHPTRKFTIEKINGFRQLNVEGSVEEARFLLGVQRTRTFENANEFEVADDIARSIGFLTEGSRNIDPGDIVVPRRGITQAGETDMAFLQRIAGNVGAVMYITGGVFHFHERRLGNPPQKTYTYFNDGTGTIIGEPQLEQNIQGRPGSVRRRGHSNRQRGSVEGSASNRTDTGRPVLGDELPISDPDGYDWETISRDLGIEQTELPETTTPTSESEAQGAVEGTTAESSEEAQSQARQGYRRAEQSAVKLNITVIGDPEVRSDETVRIAGIGEKYSGNYYVEEAVHTIGSSGYSTKLKMNRNATSRTGSGRTRARPSASADTAFTSEYGYSIDADGNFNLVEPPDTDVQQSIERDGDGAERTRWQSRNNAEQPQSRPPDPWEEE